MVHTHVPMDAVRRTVSRAAKPALAPLRAAAATLHAPGPSSPPADARESGPRSGEREPSPVEADLEELDELAAMRDELTAAPGLRLPGPDDRAARATRSASAYLEARRARLRRELRGLEPRR